MSQTRRPSTDETSNNGQAHVSTAANCPAARAIDLIAHKWTVHILFALHESGGPVRFLRLKRAVDPITQKELTKRLRDLERSGLVARRVFAEVPPRVEYRLTELGKSLIPTLVGLHDWAERHGEIIDANWRRSESSSTASRTVSDELSVEMD
jgi:DNA-binding HxlR family transcriptional regulator